MEGPRLRTLSRRLIGFGQTAAVEGTDRLAAGETYDFLCSIHPGMRGQLIVR